MDALLLLKASLLLASALVAERLLRRAAANARHTLWSVGFAAILALPALTLALPTLEVPLPSIVSDVPRRPDLHPSTDARGALSRVEGQVGRGQTGMATGSETPDLKVGPTAAHAENRDGAGQPDWTRRDIPIAALLLVTWLAGTAAAAAALAVSLLRARRLAASAQELDDAMWHQGAAAIAARVGLRTTVRLLVSPDVVTPMAGGLLRAVIFLPGDAAGWSDERRDVVLMHEITHLARRDPMRHVLARLALACYWFHPLAWVAASRAAVAREQACDEAVLALGTRPSVYARVLLDLADALPSGGRQLAALPIVERSRLENRLMAILDHDLRPASTRRVFLPVAGAILLLLPVAAAQPLVVAQPPVTMPAAVAPAHPDAGLQVVPPPAPIRPAEPAPTTTAAALMARGVQIDRARDSACWSDVGRNSSFAGSVSMSETGGRTIINEQVGWRGADRVIQKTFADLTICMVAEDLGSRERDERPSQWIGRASRVVLEARRGSAVQRLELSRAIGGDRASWQVDGRDRSFDPAAQAWRDGMLAALDTTWEISTLRGEASSLRGEISSIYGQRSSLNGEISSLRGEVSSMRGEISSVRGQESSLHGEISSIRGHVSSLRGAISSEQGAISSLNASRYSADSADRARIANRIAGHDAEIARLEKEIVDYNADARIAAVEKQIAALDVEGKVAAIEKQIRDFDLEGKVKAIERQIAALDVDGKVAGIDKQIAGLDVDRRSRQLEGRLDGQLKDLAAAIRAIR
jgi:beta-lactamase regulating signal transducer with metallopeptidase domain/predicted  nucleic acid-binding Zn-ribbon protein